MDQQITDKLNGIINSLEAAIIEARMAIISQSAESLHSSVDRLDGMIASTAVHSGRLVRLVSTGRDDTLGADQDRGETNV